MQFPLAYMINVSSIIQVSDELDRGNVTHDSTTDTCPEAMRAGMELYCQTMAKLESTFPTRVDFNLVGFLTQSSSGVEVHNTFNSWLKHSSRV